MCGRDIGLGEEGDAGVGLEEILDRVRKRCRRG